MEDHSGYRGRKAARRAVSFWYRMGLALADMTPPRACAHAYDLGRRMAALRRPVRLLAGVAMQTGEGRSGTDSFRTSSRMAGNQPCPRCGGTGTVSGVVDDIEFAFRCPCSGGDEEPVRWLLGAEGSSPADEDWSR